MAQAKAYDPVLIDHGERLNFLRESLIVAVKEIYDDLVYKLAQENKELIFFLA